MPLLKASSKALVEFSDKRVKARVAPGRTLLDAVHAAHLEISSECAGRGVCGKCRIILKSGTENVSPVTDIERTSLSPSDIQEGFRIACCALITNLGLIRVQIPLESLIEAQQLVVAGVQPTTRLDPVVRKHYVTLPKSSLAESTPDLERLFQVLEAERGLPRLRIGYDALKELPRAIRQGNWNVTSTVTSDGLITWIDPGRTTQRLYGFAIDIGTTKLAGYLVDLTTGTTVANASMINPQMNFGADVISRIEYASKGQNELKKLQNLVVNATESLIHECCTNSKVEPNDVYHVVIVGNTAMHHIFLGISPSYVALAPYTPALGSYYQTYARDVGLSCNPGCLLDALPCVAGFVGADAVADILATEIHKSPALELVVDIGTNTEIVLGDRRRLISCSSPSGPAFEGAHVKYGMRGDQGAIERVWIDPNTWEAEYRTIGGVKPRGLCGSGIVDAIASMLRAGIIDNEGRIASQKESKRVRLLKQPEYVVAWKAETQIGQDIVITQQDIEEIKLAKAAVHSGVTVLINHLKVRVEDIERIFVAGAFGTYVDPYSARTIGMYPDMHLGRISFVGNTAGSGARMAVLSKEKRTEAQKIAETLEYVELAADPEFQSEFVNSLYIPHRYPKF
jgi:uncharacterized 2Fe-2S/4Fe-4S cluster protein (DUF4445 family)